MYKIIFYYNRYIDYRYIMESEPPRAPQPIDQNAALNTMVHFLNLAQKRGVFTFEESAKIWECLKVFGAK